MKNIFLFSALNRDENYNKMESPVKFFSFANFLSFTHKVLKGQEKFRRKASKHFILISKFSLSYFIIVNFSSFVSQKHANLHIAKTKKGSKSLLQNIFQDDEEEFSFPSTRKFLIRKILNLEVNTKNF